MSLTSKTLTKLWVLAAVMLPAGLPAMAYTVKGTVVDGNDSSGLPDATVRLLHAKDSTFYKGGAADMNGAFAFQNVVNGKYIVEATYLGYNKSFVDITVKGANVKDLKVAMSENSIMLDEASVVAVKTPVKVMQDTVEYNADSYTTQPNAVVEDLLKRLPGVEVGSDGAITANGKTVSKILIDGKEFFSDDPKVASKNLPVDMVDKLQVVDRKSELARLTGVDDGDDETVINLTVKKGMQQGYFGTVLAGYGTDDRYTANFNLNRFWNGNQITLLGNANNVNELGFTDSNGNRFARFGGNRGINNSQAFGLNFNIGKEEIIRVGGNVMYSHSNRNTHTRQNRDYLLGKDSYSSSSLDDATDKGHNLRADFRVEWNPDSFNKIDFRPRFSYNTNDSGRDNFSHTDGKNENLTRSLSDGTSYEAGGRLIYTHNFKQKRGRSFSVFGNYSMSNVHENSTDYSYYKYLYEMTEEDASDWESYDQYTKNHNWNNSVGGRMSWTEPIGDAKNGNFLTLSYNATMRWNNSDKIVTQLNAESLSTDNYWEYLLNNTLYKVPQPIWGNNEAVPMDDLSSQYRYKYFNQEIRAGYRKVSKSANLEVGMSLVPQMSRGEELTGSKASIPEKWYWNYAPFMRYRYKWSGMRSLQVMYNGRSSAPSMRQLQPVADTSNPLNIVQGNPNLSPSFNHSMNVRFQDFNAETQRSVMVMGDFSLSQNSIVSRTDYDKNTGGRYTTYENVNGVWSGRLMNMFSMPLRNKNWQLNNHIFTNFNQNVGFQQSSNMEDGKALKNTSRSLMFAEMFSISYRPGNLDLSLRPNYRLQKTWNTIPTSNSNMLVHNYGGMFDGTWYTNFGLVLSTDVNYTASSGYSSGYDQNYWMWNAQVAYQFLAGKSATVAVKVYDLLQQNQNVQRSVTANYIDDTEYNSLTRYFMVTFTYRFNTFGQGNTPGGRGNRGAGHGGPMGPPPGGRRPF